MKVKELIGRLKELPQDATIGSFDTEDNSISSYVVVYNKKDIIYTCHGETSIKEIEESRLSNQSKLCDYYIGF